jgi:hypothetical protein
MAAFAIFCSNKASHVVLLVATGLKKYLKCLIHCCRYFTQLEMTKILTIKRDTYHSCVPLGKPLNITEFIVSFALPVIKTPSPISL